MKSRNRIMSFWNGAYGIGLVVLLLGTAFAGCGERPRIPIVMETPDPEPEQDPEPRLLPPSPTRQLAWSYALSMYNTPYRLEVARLDSMRLGLQLYQSEEANPETQVFSFRASLDSLLNAYPDELFESKFGPKPNFREQWVLDSVAFQFVRSNRIYLHAFCAPRSTTSAAPAGIFTAAPADSIMAADSMAVLLWTLPYRGLELGSYWTGMY